MRDDKSSIRVAKKKLRTNETVVTGDKVLQTDSRFNHIIHKYAVSSEIAISLLFFFSSFFRSLFLSLTTIQCFLSQSYDFFLHLPRILNTFRTYSFYRVSLSRCVIDSKITRRIVQDFLFWLLIIFYLLPISSFFSLSYILLFFLILSLSFSLSFSHSRTLSRSFTLHDLLRSLCASNYDISTRYLYIYKSVGWITFSCVHDSSF